MRPLGSRRRFRRRAGEPSRSGPRWKWVRPRQRRGQLSQQGRPSDRPRPRYTDRMSTLTIRQAKPEDVAASAKICYDAFYKINNDHGFPPDLPTTERAADLMSIMFVHPGFYCVVAEEDGRIVGSNCMDERSPIAGIGPIT